jgi:hypothetical protein
MPKTYLGKSHHLLIILILWILFSLGLLWYGLGLLLLYAIVLVLFRKKKTVYKETAPMNAEKVIYSPINGSVVSISKNVDHPHFGENLNEIRILIPWWSEYGIYMPVSGEIDNLIKNSGPSHFRYSRKLPSQTKDKLLDGHSLSFKGISGEEVGVQMVRCGLGLAPELWVLPGDRGKKQANIGKYPLGGTVLLYLPENYEIICHVGDGLKASDSVIGAFSETVENGEVTHR